MRFLSLEISREDRRTVVILICFLTGRTGDIGPKNSPEVPQSSTDVTDITSVASGIRSILRGDGDGNISEMDQSGANPGDINSIHVRHPQFRPTTIESNPIHHEFQPD